MIVQLTATELTRLVYHARQIDRTDAPVSISSNPLLVDAWVAAQAMERLLDPVTAGAAGTLS